MVAMLGLGNLELAVLIWRGNGMRCLAWDREWNGKGINLDWLFVSEFNDWLYYLRHSLRFIESDETLVLALCYNI